jgi:hypothetical protein
MALEAQEKRMKITIGTFDSGTGSVPVTFEHKGVRHSRSVNACFTDKGRFDKAATATRVDEVAQGVAHKIDLGVIANPPAPEEPAAEN